MQAAPAGRRHALTGQGSAVEFVGEQVHEQSVVPGAVGAALIPAHDAAPKNRVPHHELAEQAAQALNAELGAARELSPLLAKSRNPTRMVRQRATKIAAP